jgi:hypothetical protein
MKTFEEALNEAKELSEATRKDIRQLEGVLNDIGVNFKTIFTPSLTRIVANTSSEDITYEYDNRSIAFYVDGKQVKLKVTRDARSNIYKNQKFNIIKIKYYRNLKEVYQIKKII